MRYRAEIDGLRAIAVLPVILFHAGFSTFGGGYVGVDVFFVISGYLITTIIINDLAEGRFSIVRFYERRARRILPALFLVMLVCIPFAWRLFLPPDLQSFSQSLVAVTFFSSNVLFWLSSGYFEAATELKPLLHTWSLAVEEQYYLFFPPLMLLVWRLGRHRILALLALLAVLSLFAAQWGSSRFPEANFYLLPTRGWELLVGAMVAFFIAAPKRAQAHQAISQSGAWVGAVLLGYSIFTFDAQTPFPSFATLAPVAGAVLLILFATPETVIGKWLANRVLVGIGLISYSAYLWHQPVIAFARYAHVDEPSHLVMGALVATSLLLAYFSWRFVEKPFRNNQKFSRAFIFKMSAIGSLAFAGVGLVGHVTEGFEKYWVKNASANKADFYRRFKAEDNLNKHIEARAEPFPDNGACRFNARSISPEIVTRLLACRAAHGKGMAILGDSHAIDLYGVASQSDRQADFLVGFTKMHCRPNVPAVGCQYNDFAKFVENNPQVFTAVVYEQAGFYLMRHQAGPGTREMFSRVPLDEAVSGIEPDLQAITLVRNYLERIAKVLPVIWFGPRLEPHITKNHILQYGCTYNYKLRRGQQEVFQSLDSAISDIAEKAKNIQFVSQVQLFAMEFPRDLLTCQSLYWSDGDHLSQEGEAYFAQRFSLPRLLRQ